MRSGCLYSRFKALGLACFRRDMVSPYTVPNGVRSSMPADEPANTAGWLASAVATTESPTRLSGESPHVGSSFTDWSAGDVIGRNLLSRHCCAHPGDVRCGAQPSTSPGDGRPPSLTLRLPIWKCMWTLQWIGP